MNSIAQNTVVRTWQKPAFLELRLGFEITLYIMNR